MSRGLAAALSLLLLLGAVPRAARGQTAVDALAQAISSYQDLEYDSAATQLRRALGRSGTAALADSDRVRALLYLGATEFFRDRRDSATAAFRSLVLLDPRYRPSQLIFPPEVSSLFEEVRLGTRAAGLLVPTNTEIAGPADRLVMRLYASSYHQVTVTIASSGGAPLRTLFSGAVGDSLELLWDGRDSTGSLSFSGNYAIRATSRGSDGATRVVEVPLEIRRAERDTLPLPPPPADSQLLPERARGRRSPRALLTGLAAAAAVVVLPPLVTGDATGSSARFAVAAAVGTSGLLGFQLPHRPRPIAENIAANQALRRAWEREAAAVHATNLARLRDPRLLIRAFPARTLGAR